MNRGELQALLLAYFAQGGRVERLPDEAVSVDWTQTRFRAAARVASSFGHAKRWEKAA